MTYMWCHRGIAGGMGYNTGRFSDFQGLEYVWLRIGGAAAGWMELEVPLPRGFGDIRHNYHRWQLQRFHPTR